MYYNVDEFNKEIFILILICNNQILHKNEEILTNKLKKLINIF
jgi:hypothetical protein